MDLQQTIEATFIRPPSTQNDVQKAENRNDRSRDEDRGLDNRFDDDLHAELSREAQRQREAQDEALRAAQARRARQAGTTEETVPAPEASETPAQAASTSPEETEHADTGEHSKGSNTSGEENGSEQHASDDNPNADENTAATTSAGEDAEQSVESPAKESTAEPQPVSDLAARLAANTTAKAAQSSVQQASTNAIDPATVAALNNIQATAQNQVGMQSGITVTVPQETQVTLNPISMTPGQAAMQGKTNTTAQTANNGTAQTGETISADVQAALSKNASGMGDAVRQSAEGQQNQNAQFKLDVTQLTMSAQDLGLQAPTNMSAATAASAIQVTDSIAPQIDMSGTSNNVSGIDSLRLSSDTTTQTQLTRAAPQQMARPAAEQIAIQVNKNLDKGVNKFEIKLNPAELGRVEVKMEVGFDGRMQATVAVERAETLQLLQRDSHALERALQDAGLKTDENSLSFTLKDQGNGNGTGDGDGKGVADNGPEDVEELTTENIVQSLRHPLGQGVLDIRA